MSSALDIAKRGLLHPDLAVRMVAFNLIGRRRPNDLTIMPIIIEAVEKYGYEQAFEDYESVWNLPQTDATMRWLMESIHVEAPDSFAAPRLDLEQDDDEVDENEAFSTWWEVLLRADIDLLKTHQAEIAELPDPSDLYFWVVESRLSLHRKSPENLWQDLKNECMDSTFLDFQGDEGGNADLLVEELVHHPKFATKKALKGIEDEVDGMPSCLACYSVRLVGRLRLAEALPKLLEFLPLESLEVQEECKEALIALGSEQVVEGLLAIDVGSSAEDVELHSTIAYVLANIGSPRAVAALLQRYQERADAISRHEILLNLLYNLVPEAVELARQFLLKDFTGPTFMALRADLIAVCQLLDMRFPEYEEWKQRVAVEAADLAAWRAGMDSDTLDDDDFYGESGDPWGVNDIDEFEEDEEAFDDDDVPPFGGPLPALPFMREAPIVGRNDPCPCGSGKKFKKCCLANEDRPSSPQTFLPRITGAPSREPDSPSGVSYPMGTLAYYGPDDRTTTKIVAGVFKSANAKVIMERWVGTHIKDDPKVIEQVTAFFKKHGVTQIATVDQNMGCPHEEGPDFPVGQDCPFCPFWKGKQGSGARF